MTDRAKIFWLSTLVVGMGAALLWHYTQIHLYGQVLIREPSVLILWAETILLTGITAFAIWCFARVMWR